MAQLIVRNIEDEVRDRLRDLAERHGRSMEEEVRDILRAAVVSKASQEPVIRNLGTWCVEQFGHLDDGDPVVFEEIRTGPINPPTFE
jgi:plasmid stability protein